jgi:phosphatidylglycerol:prolipoprotein diacylglycerol transferase
VSLRGPYVHDIDPIVATVFGVHLWWYGLAYAVGFCGLLFFLLDNRGGLGLSRPRAYGLAIWVALGALLGGRLIEVLFYEWPFYRTHPRLIVAYWLGGMATHGLLLGGVAGVAIFSWLYGRSLLALADVLVVPAAFIMGTGRVGNFVDGQIVGSLTDVWWGVKFPDAGGFRHPVVLYDGIKNLLLVPLLVSVRRRHPPRGMVTGLFLLLYASVRIFVDLYREYTTTLLGLATGQGLNVLVSAIGLALVVTALRRHRRSDTHAAGDGAGRDAPGAPGGVAWRRLVFVALLLFSLTLPSDWTQDVPARYGKRHPGLRHSVLYPAIDTRAD